MQLMLDPLLENGRHGEWMARTPGSYEWWYADVISEDRQWSLVTIFLLGNPFSPYYRLTARKIDTDPLEHNAVFIALHRKGFLRHYLFASYPKGLISSAPTVLPDLCFGPNRLTYSEDGGLLVTICEENGNLRQIEASIHIDPPRSVFGARPTVDKNAGHWWLPAIPTAAASVEIAVRSPGVSPGVELISFRGDGYHDHNWGTLPFDQSLRSWTWARADFGGGFAAIIYWTTTMEGVQKCLLLRFAPDQPVKIDENVKIKVRKWKLTWYGIRFPQRIAVTVGGLIIEFFAEDLLESVPFYIRYRQSAVLYAEGVIKRGFGMGEYFRPGIMSSAIGASAMNRRIYRPQDGC